MNMRRSAPVCGFPYSRKFVMVRAIQRCFDGCAVLAAAGVLIGNPTLAQTPRISAGAPRIPVNALPNGPGAGFGVRQPQIVAGDFNPYSVNGNTATITQKNSGSGILRWGSFDIGTGAEVDIVQQGGATAVLLNKVDGGVYLNKTVIEGMLKANGQVYIYNPNGIIFGKNSQVDVNSLVATTLKIDDKRFLAGLLAPNITPVFVADPDAKNTDATLVGAPGAITVEGDNANQARLSAAQGGRILLVAPSIVNNGQLSALDGQVVLAAGNTVYLASPSDIRMRGLLVEVNNDAVTSSNGNPAVAAVSSTATNDVLGTIKVGTGNATLVGLAVNQMGVVSATTSVNVNGSIYLHARDGASQGTVSAPNAPNHGGTLVLGANSTTEILPTLDDPTTSSGSSFNASLVDLSGNSVYLQSNARIVAPAGEVNVVSSAVADSRGVVTPHAGSNITLDAGAVIDVSGTTSTLLTMESNVIKVDLRGTELADDPLLRNSVLRGQTVSVDARKGNLLFANIQGWLDLLQHNVGERTAVGGTVNLQADDSISLGNGSRIDVSGGMVSYLPGHVATTQLTSNGIVFDINSATSDRIYDGVIAATPGPRNFQAGYSQGYSAGTIKVDAPALALNGTLRGTTTPGPKQRDVSSASRPLGGQLIVGNQVSLADNPEFFYKGPVTIGSGNSGLVLDPLGLTQEGFTRLSVYTDGAITVDSAVKLAPGGSLTLVSGGAVELAAGISAAGGTVLASSQSQVAVAPGVTVDVSGQWTNDRVVSASERDAQGNLTSPIVTKGGSINLSAPVMTLASEAHLDASGGAWLNGSAKQSSGDGGSISVSASTDPVSAQLTLGKDVSFSAYGVSNGGKLTLSGPNVTVGGTSFSPFDLGLGVDFFQLGGFSSYDIRAAGNLTVAAGSTVAPRMDNWIASRSTSNTASGTMSSAFGITTLPLAGLSGSRNATNLSLSALPQSLDGMGRLDLQAGASIVADPGATVSLSAGRQLTVDGTVRAPGGAINLALTSSIASVPFRSERSIWIGAQAVLDASGTSARLWQDRLGLTHGNLLDGGSIKIGQFTGTDLTAAPGYVVVEQGARLDVSGTMATMILPLKSRGGREAKTVASAGGSIDIRAREGLLFEGSLSAAGGNASAAGGSLSLVLDRENIDQAGYPTEGRNLIVESSSNTFPTLDGPDTALSGWEGKGFVTANSINQGGFDWVGLKSQNVVSFDLGAGNLGLQARAGVIVDAPAIAAAPGAKANSAITLAAPYVELGNSDWRYQSAPAATASLAGGVALRVNADTVDIIGKSALQGFDAATISASGDIRLVGQVPVKLATPTSSELPSLVAAGSFEVAGTMDFTSAQLYPTTMSQFLLSATGTGSRITFAGNNNPASVPLSAAGSLKVTAQEIDQNGVVRAPLGQIILDAADALNYGANSLTSVAGSGLIPLGFVQNGRDWLYDFGSGNTVNLSDSTATNYFALPDKSIVSRGSSVTFGRGAVQDLSGGGDLYAYEFTPGPGGSKDVLAKSDGSTSTNVFAILPGYSSAVAPQDFQYAQDGGLKPGDSIYLSGIAGLKAGYYTLLPAHYALMAGAYSVTAVSGRTDMVALANAAKLDGSWLVSGYRAALGGGVNNRSSGFLVTPASVVRQQSQFADYYGNSFLTALASLPKDGGHVVFDVAQSLTLDGLVRLGAISGGRNGIADISAPDIAIVADRSDALPDGLPAGALKLAAGDLVALGAGSLLIGGVRNTTSAGDQVSVGADKVTVANDAAHPLTGPEVILVADDTVQLKSGSAVVAKGALSRTPRNLVLSNKSVPTTGADGALLRISNGAAVAIERSYTAADGTISAPLGTAGTLDVAANVTLSASGSMMLDATKSTTISSSLDLADGAALGLGASRINLGSDAPINAGDGSLRFDTTAIGKLNNLKSVALTSYSTFDIYGTVSLGNTTMQSLSFTGGGMRGMTGSNPVQATFAAQTIRFDRAGTDGVAATAPVSSAEFNASDIEIGNGVFGLHGFATVNLYATNEIRAAGKGGALSADNDLTLAAGRITARGGDDATVTAGRKLVLTRGSGAVGDLPALEFGGKLAFAGKTIVSDAAIVALAGQVSLTATATADDIANGLDVTGGAIKVSGGTISAAGGSETFGSTVAYAPAGSIALDGGAGDVTVGSAATLDVSAIGAAAGTISVKAVNASGTGKAILDGSLQGRANAGVDGVVPTQGNFVMDVDKLDPAVTFGALNAKLNDGGFAESRNFRVRHDDITLAADQTVIAHQAVISADNGNIIVAGTIDAQGKKGGSIELYAAEDTAGSGRGNVTIAGGARLLANATAVASSAAGSAGDGGSVVIGTSTADGSQPNATSGDASISVQSGAIIDVSNGPADTDGSRRGQGGTVLLRAPRLSANNDVAIATLDASTIQGSRSTAIEGYKVYTASTITADAASATNLQVANATGAPFGKMYTEANNFIANGGTILGRLTSDPSVALQPGMEVRSSGDLSVSVNETSTAKQNRGWNLDAWRFNGQPGVLTLRAGGNLLINGSISDGFTKSTTASMPGWLLDTTASGASSWSYRLVGGADQTAANPQATTFGAGDVKFSFARTAGSSTDLPVALVRTGTGFINVAAGRDVLLDTLDLSTGTLLGGSFISMADFNSDKLLGASIYTAGRATTLPATGATWFTAPSDKNNAAYGSTTSTDAVFTSDGGSISLLAGSNVVGPVTDQMINNWLFRQGRSYIDSNGAVVFDTKGKVQNTAWWSRFDYFNQGIATFGGGDISVIAETGNVTDVSASVATNAYVPSTTPGGMTPASSLVEQGGGDLLVRAGGDIRGGSFYVQKGSAVLTANGSVIAGDHVVEDLSITGTSPNGGTLVALRTMLAAGDAQFNVTAGKNLEIEGVFNPTMTAQSANNVTGSINDPLSQTPSKLPAQFGTYSTYGADSAVSLISISGDLILAEHANAMYLAGGSELRSDLGSALYLFQPGTLFAGALGGDIRIGNGFSLAPSASGQLDLLARGNILINFRADAISQPVVMMDRDPSTMPIATNPVFMDQSVLDAMRGSVDGLSFHTNGGLHTTDPDPVRIIAINGDISSGGDNNNVAAALVLPKRAEISAGRDITNLGFNIQQLSATDVTTVSAGRDISNSTMVGGQNVIAELVSGPGRVDFTAGRNFDLGNSAGVVTRGNLDNSYLPADGSGINVIAGATPDYAGFSNRYASTLGDLSSTEQDLLVADMKQWLKQLQPSITKTDLDNLTPLAAWTAFNSLPINARKSVLNDLFYDKLARVTGAKGGGTLDLIGFDGVIASLFPTANITGGDINVFGSQLKTDRGGAINVFAPGGSVFAGLVDTPAYLKSKAASDLGVFTIGGGAIQALVKSDFLVNQGRVFTLGGGDITLVSQYGNIDAGKGAKTAQSAPPPVLTTDDKGNTKVDISGSISGSGIATLRTGSDVPASNVYPIAPRGIFDAGDAGVRSTGSVTIVAQTVLNANNISAAGAVSGAHTTDTSGLGAAVSVPSNAPVTKTDDITKNLENRSSNSGGALSVEVIGFGGDQQDVTRDGQNAPSASGKTDSNNERTKKQK